MFYWSLPSGPFYGFDRPGAVPVEAFFDNWWRRGLLGGAKGQYDGIVAFSQTDFVADLRKISVSVLVMHGDDDQIVPYADSGPLTAKLVQNGTLKTYHGFPHGMPITQTASINADLLAWLNTCPTRRRPFRRYASIDGRCWPLSSAIVSAFTCRSCSLSVSIASSRG